MIASAACDERPGNCGNGDRRLWEPALRELAAWELVLWERRPAANH